jgi:hypothetical protein
MNFYLYSTPSDILFYLGTLVMAIGANLSKFWENSSLKMLRELLPFVEASRIRNQHKHILEMDYLF